MRAIPHRSKMRYLLGNNPTGELLRIITHKFTTADKRNRWKLSIGNK